MISANNYCFVYNNSSKRLFNNISFHIAKGDFCILCGPSGYGKSTLLKLIKKELSPKGTAEGYLDVNIPSEAIGFLFQNPDNQILLEAVYDELAFGMSNKGFTDSDIKRRICEISAFFGFSDKLYSNTARLSGGEKQMVALGSIMALTPDLLLLDEPSSMLDPLETERLYDFLGKLNKEYGITIICCEHNLEKAWQHSNKLILLDKTSLYFDHMEAAKEYLLQGTILLIEELPASMLLDSYHINTINNNIYSSLPTHCSLEEEPHKSLCEIHTEDEAALNIKELSFSYREQDVLCHLNLKLSKGTITSIAGANGCGKSTLLKIVAGGLKASKGKITAKGSIAYLPQNPMALFIKDTLYEDFKLLTETLGKPLTIIDELIEKYPIFSILPPLYNSNPYDLSGGEAAIAAIFKLCISDRDIFLLDEPNKGLDSYNSYILGDLLKALAYEGKTILLTTHNMEFATYCCSTMCLLFDGHIIVNESTKDFVGNNIYYTTPAYRLTKNTYCLLNRREIVNYGKSHII